MANKRGRVARRKAKKRIKKSTKAPTLTAASAKILELKLDNLERSRQEYKENAKRLVVENAALQNQMQQTERDTIDVVTFLKKEDQVKEELIEKLKSHIQEMMQKFKKDKESTECDYLNTISDLETKLQEKEENIQLMQTELKNVKEFQRRRFEMQKDLDEIKDEFCNTKEQHKNTLHKMEKRVLLEKNRLKQEADQKIAELAGQAHSQAVINIDEHVKSVFKENIRLAEALNFHLKERSDLVKAKEHLAIENKSFKDEKEVSDKLIKEKIQENKMIKANNSKLQKESEILQNKLNHVQEKHEAERNMILREKTTELNKCYEELSDLHSLLKIQQEEEMRMKRLAGNILKQRTQMEEFFLQALQDVKQEIIKSRLEYRKHQAQQYKHQMREAQRGSAVFPPIKTFTSAAAAAANYKTTTSTNHVMNDIPHLNNVWPCRSEGKVDMNDLTWEQKERVLRLLFAKLNNQSDRVITRLPRIISGATINTIQD